METFTTVNEKQPRAEAVAIKGGKFVFVGSNADAAQYETAGVRVVDLQGKTVVPGLTDSHVHLDRVGEREVTLNLEGTQSLDEFLAKVKERVDKAKPGDWVTGRGWIETPWNPQTFPTRQDLDKISPNNPVFLTRADAHGAVANSAAIQLAKITKDMPNPFGGEIMHDKQTGEPNGMFLDNAQALINTNIPPATPEENERAILLGAKREESLGWTEIHFASGSQADLAILKKLYGENKIKLRTYVSILGPSDDTKKLLTDGPLMNAFDGRLTCRAIKVSFDGALGSKGAALLKNIRTTTRPVS